MRTTLAHAAACIHVFLVFVTHSSLLEEFDLSEIKHVSTVWPLTLTSAPGGGLQLAMGGDDRSIF